MEGKEKLDRQSMALRVAKEFQDGDVVNLGYGLPVLASNFVPVGREVLFHTENGALGYGAIMAPGEGSPDLINAQGQAVTPQPGVSFFGHDESFAMIRGGHVDISVLGGFQVSKDGDLANWTVPQRVIAGRTIGTIGGGMDLAAGAKKVIIAMNHVTKTGEFKIVNKCNYPLTAVRCVKLIITDIAVIELTDKGLVLKEVAPGWTAEEVQKLTEPKLIIDPECKDIELM